MAQKWDNFSVWIQSGFDLYKNNFLTLLAASAIAIVLSVVSLGILAGPMVAGMICLILGFLDKREPKPEMSTVFKGFDWFLQSFLYCLVWFVILQILGLMVVRTPFLGRLLFAVIQWAGSAFLAFGLFLIVDKKMDFWPAAMTSIKKVYVNFWPVLAICVLSGLLASIGSIFFLIGAIVTAPIGLCVMSVVYRDLFKE